MNIDMKEIIMRNAHNMSIDDMVRILGVDKEDVQEVLNENMKDVTLDQRVGYVQEKLDSIESLLKDILEAKKEESCITIDKHDLDNVINRVRESGNKRADYLEYKETEVYPINVKHDVDYMSMNFYQRLRNLGYENNIFKDYMISKYIGMNLSYISCLKNKVSENSTYIPSSNALLKISKAFNVSIDFLLGKTNEH